MGRLEALLQGPLRMRRGMRSAGAAHSIVLGSLAVTAAQLAVGGLFALTSLYLVRSLSTHEYGRVAFGIFLYSLLQAVVSLGLGTGVMAEVARGRRSNGVPWPRVYALLWVRILSVVPLLLIGFGWAAASGTVLPAMAAVMASTSILAEFLIGVLAGGLRTRAYVLVTLCQPAIFALLLILGQVHTAESALIALGTALALSLLVAVSFLGRGGGPRVGRPRVSLSELGHAIGVARNDYLIGALNIGFISIPVILLGALGRYAEAAAMSIVMTLVRFAPEALGFAVEATYFPRLKAAEPNGREGAVLFGMFARLLAVLAIPAALGLAIMGRPLFAVLFAGKYDELAPYLAIGSLLVVMLPLETLLAWTLVARNDGRTALLAIGLRVAVVLAACLELFLGRGRDSVLLLLIASAAGVIMSVAIQGLRAHRSESLARPARMFAVYAVVAAVAYLGLRAALAGVTSDLAMVVATGLVTIPVLAFGGWLLLRRADPAEGAAP